MSEQQEATEKHSSKEPADTLENVLKSTPSYTPEKAARWLKVLEGEEIYSVEGLRKTVGTSAWSSVQLPAGVKGAIEDYFTSLRQGKYTYANQNRRCFVIEGATLSVGLKQFQADLLVDSGASFELELPFSKVVQFGLIETNSESGDAAFEKFTVHYLFPDVTVTLPTTDGKTISKNLTAVYGQAGENRPPKIRQTLEQQPPPANTTTSPVIQLSPIKQGSEKYELPTLGFLGLARLGLEINFRTNTLTLGKMIFKSHGYANRISTPIAKLDFGTK
eukprot:TRINITY_DN135_c1_g1_i10.p1 TRINITY_DN135_c1_g1~~TRINITY_DN135_c1_g1_i10.p1  ORF type:complete len:276 (-),score=40.93 TRINITY_DN135_c1_g1_i10:70-897(-)